MLEKIRFRRSLNESVSIGDVIYYRQANFVVINIISVNVALKASGNILYDCLCQQVQTPDLSAEYMTTQAEIVYQPHEFNEISEVGEFIYDESTGIWVQINAIISVRFEDNNIHVKYEFTPVVEWSDNEIKVALNNKRRKQMKLLKSTKDHLANNN